VATEALADLVGTSPAIAGLRRRLERLLSGAPDARSAASVLLRGEEGTGKSLLARLIHLAGPRRDGPFVNVSCASVPATTVQEELFAPARGGTLYLDEVGLLSASLQAGLHALIERQAGAAWARTGGDEAIRVIAGSSADLAAAVRARGFHDDLYRRLAAIALDLPPLRDRGRDVLMLAERFLARFARDYETPPKRLDRSARAALLEHQWPGNVRELANIVERAVLATDASVVGAGAIGLPLVPSVAPGSGRLALPPASFSRAEVHRRHLQGALERTGWNIARTAALLGLARNTEYSHIRKFDLGPAAARPAAARRGRPLERPAPEGDTRLRWERRSVTLLRGEWSAGRSRTQARRSRSSPRRWKALAVASRSSPPPAWWPSGFTGSTMLRGAPHTRRWPCLRPSSAAGPTGPAPRVRIGVHAALMLVGRRGGRISIDADAGRAEGPRLGRLLEFAAPGDTVVGAGIAPLLRRRFELEPLAEGGGEVSRLAGPERRGLDVWGTLTPFVGRRAELATLQVSLARARAGHGEAVLVVGEAGVGKSRVMWELAHSPTCRTGTCSRCAACPSPARPPSIPSPDCSAPTSASRGSPERSRRGPASPPACAPSTTASSRRCPVSAPGWRFLSRTLAGRSWISPSAAAPRSTRSRACC
jgi:DNA-binding NtrC family response regulator